MASKMVNYVFSIVNTLKDIPLLHMDQLYVIETQFCHLENEGPI